MVGIFLKLVNLSITAGWLVLAVLLLRALMKKAPKWVHCAMWGLVGIRLVFPFSLESIFSLIPSAETFEPEMLKSRQFEINTGIEVLDTSVNDYMASHYYEGVTAPANFKVDVTSVLAVIWLIGVSVMLGYAIFSYLKLKADLKTATLWEDNRQKAVLSEDDKVQHISYKENKEERSASQASRNYKVRQSDKVDSPFVLGFLRPVIYLPYNINETDRAYVIAHEEAHMKRKDHWVKPIGFLILSVYWFHPLLWLAYVMLCKDIELACDEKVIHSLGYDERQDYSLALLNCSIKRYRIAACPLAFGEVSVKERVKSVMYYKKPGLWVVVASVVVCVIVAACFLTNPAYKELYAPEPFCHSYRVEEVVYDAPQYSFSYTPETAPKYSLTSDYGFLEQQANSGDWKQISGGFDEVKLTKDNFDAFFSVVGRVSGFAEVSVSEQAGMLQAKQVAKLRKENKKAWRLDVLKESGGMNTEDVFYYLMLQKNGDVYLSFGYDYTDREEEGLSNETIIRWLFKLNLREEVCISVNTTEISYNWVTSGGEGDTGKGDLSSAGASGLEGITGLEENVYHFTAQVNESCEIVFETEYETDTLVVYEDYYYPKGEEYTVTKKTYRLKGMDNTFSLPVSRRSDIQDEYVIYRLETDDGVIAFKVEFLPDFSVDDFEAEHGAGGAATDGENTGSGGAVAEGENAGSDSIEAEDGQAEKSTATELENSDAEIQSFSLDEAISEAILAYNKERYPQGEFACESHAMIGSETTVSTPGAGEKSASLTFTYYVMAYYQVYSTYGGELKAEGGSHMPVRLTFKSKMTNQNYELSEYWAPSSGGEEYVTEVKEYFPESYVQQALDTQQYAENLRQQCYEKALAYMEEQKSVDTRIEALLESIVSAAGTSSNPQDYINTADKEYAQLKEYGEYTLRYCFTEFLKDGQMGLRGHIMAQACQDIMAAMGEALLIEFEPANGQEWFDEFLANAHALQEQYGDEELEKYYPASRMVLKLQSALV